MKFGLIGYPISHSLSPRLWAEAFPGQEHSYDLIEEEHFDAAFARFLDGYSAVNVTMPFKELAYYRSRPADESVRAIKAVNILKKEGDEIVGYNSDFLAVRKLLSDTFPVSAEKSVMIIGAGGAARAAAIAAVSLGFSVTMANRSHENCLAFVRHTTYAGKPLDVNVVEMKDAGMAVEKADVLIYAVPKPVARVMVCNLASRIVIEANYLDPCLRAKTASEGGIYVSGEEWLRLQAEFGYKLFF